MESDRAGRNGHYSELTGHMMRGQHRRAENALGGMPPEAVPGFQRLEVPVWTARRSSRRIPRDGR